MTGRLSADTLDLSRFPAPLAIKDLDFEAILAERLARLKLLWPELDTETLEYEPGVILEQADAYRELLVKAEINDAVRAVMVAFAVGADLDHLAAFYGIQRLDGESDDAFRRRALLAPEAMACAGPRGAYIFHALSADVRVKNVDVWSPGPGEIIVAVQSAEGDGTASDELVEVVRAYLARPDIKPLTDMLTVRSVVNVGFAIELEAFVLPGPSTALVRDQIIESEQAMTASRRTPSRDMPRSAVIAAAQIGPVDKVTLISPAADIARDHGEVAVCTAIEVTVTTYDG